MATDSASTRFRANQLWQWPVFITGVLSLVTVWYARPYWRLTPAERFQQDLQALRQAVDKVPSDPVQIEQLLRKVEAQTPNPHQLSETWFLCGAARVALAENETDVESAGDLWKQARHLLEEAQQAGVPEGDQLRLNYRLAKTWMATGVETEKVIEAMEASLNGAEDLAEGRRLLAELVMRLDPPDLKKARDGYKDYLSKILPARTDAQNRILMQSRVRLGQIHLQLNEVEEGRKILERISTDAPTEILIAARSELARSYQADEDWAQALKYWELARDTRGVTSAMRGSLLVPMAECYLRLNRRQSAMQVLEELRQLGGIEAQAAAFKLAELQLQDPSPQDKVLATLEKALEGVNRPEQYHNTLFSLKDARALFEQAIQATRIAGNYPDAMQIIRMYHRIAKPGRDSELLAETLEAWGSTPLPTGGAQDPELARQRDEQTQRLREAADKWYELAGQKKNAEECGDHLRRAATLYQKIGALADALKMLDELGLKVSDYPAERLPEVWLQKGDIYLAMDNPDQARLCFQNGVQAGEMYASPALFKCRLRLAEILLKGKDPKNLSRAIADLEKLLTEPEVTRDKTTHEHALILMADAFYYQQDFPKAEVRYRMTLDSYPDGERSVRARFHLGLCYWRLAGQEADRCKAMQKIMVDPASDERRKNDAEREYQSCYKRYMDLLRRAAEPLRAVESQLLPRLDSGPKLTREEEDLLRRASLCAADCSFFLGDYDDCLARYDALTQRYAGTIVQLEAYRAMIQCHRHLRNEQKVRDLLTQMRTVFAQMPESVFDGTSDLKKREYWQTWIERMPGT